MRNCNFLLNERRCKVKDLVAYYKATKPRLSEDRINAIANINLADSKTVALEWANLPAQFKGLHKLSVGCA